jgi:hypothetical protein
LLLDRFEGEENVTVDYFGCMSSLSEAAVTTIELEADAVRPLLAPIRAEATECKWTKRGASIDAYKRRLKC